MATIKLHKNKLIITRSLGVLAVFGIPLIVLGILIILLFSSFQDYWPGVILVLLGLVITAGRTGIIFNRDTRQIISWWGIGFSFQGKYQSLDLYNKLILDQRIDVVIDDDGYNIYYLQMISDHQLELDPFLLYQSTDLLEVRVIAKQIALYVDKPLQDKNLDQLLTHQPKAFKCGLAYRLRLQNQQKYSLITTANQPELTIKETEGKTEINVLPCGFFNSFLAFLPYCIAVSIFCIFMMKHLDVSIIHQSMALITITSLLFISTISYFTICAGKSVTRILIDTNEIRVDQYAMFGRSEQVLQIQEIEEIFISEHSNRILSTIDRQVLCLVSKTQTIEITGIHSSEKLIHLKNIIGRIINFPVQTEKFEMTEKTI